MQHDADLQIENHGSIYLLRPVSPIGKQWIEDNIAPDATTFGNAIAVEHRYIGDIAAGAANDGLIVR